MAHPGGDLATSARRLIKDRYDVIETLGAGGEGRVVKALDRQHDRLVALKIRAVRDDRLRDELLSEARILLAIPPHPALPLVREDFFDGERYVVAMDWVDGTDLARLLAQRGRPGLAPSSVLAHLAQAAEALTHLHSQHPPVIHGDVKPANLILTRGGRVKLVDFGMSSAPDALRPRTGTPGYRAPELAADGVPSRASDVYALAATAFALLSGSPPSGVLPSWDGFEPAQAAQLEAALRLGLATDPARRPATPGELVESLRSGWGAALPTGVMTFCLSDIEDSAALWDGDSAAMAEALVRHDEIIAAHVEARGGRFVKPIGEGDSTVSVFVSAPQALDAAVAAARALHEGSWPGGRRLAVRFGLHTGEAERRGADYAGPTLNVAARLRGQADGGQIFVSAATAALVARDLPSGYELVDLGPDRLHGRSGPERIHAVKGSGISAPLPASKSPYRGLLAFEPGDRRFFFGREQVVEEIVARLAPGRLLTIVGASGSGKSSVLRAGVAGAVLAGQVEGIDRARVITPGAEPRLGVTDDPRELLVVDQFEELYTLCEDAGSRAAFIDRLLALASPVVIGVRADLYGRLSGHADLARAVADDQILLGAMGDEELERAITEPARVAGLRLEAGLVELILRDVAREPGALPLLSHALRVTWEQRDGRTLTVGGYRSSGGVASAIAQTADSVVAGVPADRRSLVRNLFLRLTETGEGAQDTRRRVAVEELVPDGASEEEVRELLGRLAEARLVTLGQGTAEVAHEVLIREWPTLRAWLEEDRAGIRLQRRLGDAARLWEAGTREAADLYRGTRLAAALEWAQSHPDELNARERAFLDESVAESGRERSSQIRANRRLRVLLGGVGLLLVAAVIAGVLALRAGERARDTARTADAQRLGAQALVDDRLERSLLLAQAGRVLDDSVATRGNLLSALVRHPAAVGVLRGGTGAVFALALSPDGRTLAAGDDAGSVVLIDTRTRERIGRPLMLDREVWEIGFSPDGRLLVVTSGVIGTGVDAHSVKLLDTASMHLVREIDVGRVPGAADKIVDARFDATGRAVIATVASNSPAMPFPTRLRRYDVRTGRPIGRAVRIAGSNAIPRNAVSSRRMLFSAGDALVLVDPSTLRVIRRVPVRTWSAGLSPDGRSVGLGGEDGSVRILDLETGKRRTLAGRHEDRVQGLVFSSDGRTLATRSDDGRVLIWDLRAGNVRETLTGHTGAIPTLVASADGRTLYTGGLDKRIIVWDLAGDQRLARPFQVHPFQQSGFAEFAPPLAVSPSGRIVAAGRPDGGVSLHDAHTLRHLRDLPGEDDGPVMAVEFSPDGAAVATTGEGGQVELRDVTSGRPLWPPLPGLGHPAQALGLSPDGGRLAVADLDGNLRLLDLETGAALESETLDGYALHLSFSPDGRTLAVGLGERTELRDGRSLRVVARLQGSAARGGEGTRVRFSPDGRLLAVGAFDGYTRLWDVATRRPVGSPLAGHEAGVATAEFSPDGRMLATSGLDGTVILWDIPSRRSLGTLPGPLGFTATRFSRDGRHLFVLRETGLALRWEVTPDAWSQHACRVAGRDLTPAEWADLVPDEDYRRVCA
ncbi:MAG TPA: protein kinase [Solirubrobacteraceae bacterium]|nr:protein kinase [Solirubrobacteraceae bacterium]